MSILVVLLVKLIVDIQVVKLQFLDICLLYFLFKIVTV